MKSATTADCRRRTFHVWPTPRLDSVVDIEAESRGDAERIARRQFGHEPHMVLSDIDDHRRARQ